MRSENFDWFRELGADSGKTPNSLLKPAKFSRRVAGGSGAAPKPACPQENLQIILQMALRWGMA
jgi:hypothetical protein